MHHKIQEEQHHIIPYPLWAWCCREGGLLTDMEISSLVKPLDGVRLWACCGQQWVVYGCGCVVVDRPNRFMTFVEMRFFWLPLSTMNCSVEPFTHIWEWKSHSPFFGSSGSPLDLGGGHSGIGLHIDNLLAFAIPLVGFCLKVRTCIWLRSLQLGHQWLLGPTLICVVSGAFMELTSLCPPLASWWCSSLAASTSCLGSLASVLFFVLWFGGTFPMLLIHRSKVLLILFKFLLNLGSIPVRCTKWGGCRGTLFPPGCICANNCGTTFFQMFDAQLRALGME